MEVRGGGGSYVSQAQARSQRVEDVLGQVRVLRVPDQADGDHLRTVEENPSGLELLPTLALRRWGEEGEEGGKRRGRSHQSG